MTQEQEVSYGPGRARTCDRRIMSRGLGSWNDKDLADSPPRDGDRDERRNPRLSDQSATDSITSSAPVPDLSSSDRRTNGNRPPINTEVQIRLNSGLPSNLWYRCGWVVGHHVDGVAIVVDIVRGPRVTFDPSDVERVSFGDAPARLIGSAT